MVRVVGERTKARVNQRGAFGDSGIPCSMVDHRVTNIGQLQATQMTHCTQQLKSVFETAQIRTVLPRYFSGRTWYIIFIYHDFLIAVDIRLTVSPSGPGL